MKSYKERTIKAIHKTIAKYEKALVDLEGFSLCMNTCHLCKVYNRTFRSTDCNGCILAHKNGGVGCTDFDSYNQLEEVYETLVDDEFEYESSMNDEEASELRIALKNRILFWKDYVLPIIDTFPKKQFTPSGWKHFNLNTLK